MVSPHAADLVNHRLQGVGVRRYVFNAEVASDIGVHQREERDQQQPQLRHRGRTGDRHPATIVLMRADHRNGGLGHRDAQREDQCKMADFNDHFLTSPSACFHFPDFFSASATSGGI